MNTPTPLISSIRRYVKETYLPKRYQNPKTIDIFNHHDYDFFAPAVADISNLFTAERDDLPKNYLNMKEYRSAYLLYFTIPNYLKMVHVLSQAKQSFPTDRPISILDLGTGSGTALLAAADLCRDMGLSAKLIGIDQNGPILRDAAGIFSRYHPEIKPSFITRTLSPRTIARDIPAGQYDIIMMSNVLNEWAYPERVKALLTVRQQFLRPGGTLIIVEPALQAITRDLMQLRDDLLAHAPTPYQVVAPCLHQGPCPMIRHNARDWCHAYLEWERPELIVEFDRRIGNRKEYLKYAYLVLRAIDSLPPAKADHYRVVSSPLVSKGKLELLLCRDADRLRRLSRLDKDRSRENVALEEAERGDIITYTGDDRVEKSDHVTIVATQNK